MLPLAPTLAPLVAGDVRAALRLIAESGFRFVQLSAALEGLRPRDLDRSGRRDLLARLRRIELAVAGLDLWIPEEHYASVEHADRAAIAVLEAIELAADLGRVPLSIRLPDDARGVDANAIASWRERAETCGVAIADHTLYATDRATNVGAVTVASASGVVAPPAGESRAAAAGAAAAGNERALPSVGVDPAALLAAGVEPTAYASRAGELAAARFSDFAREGRVRPGAGRLDVLAYQVALLSRGHRRPVALDLRQVAEPWVALEPARRAWVGTGLLNPRGV